MKQDQPSKGAGGGAGPKVLSVSWAQILPDHQTAVPTSSSQVLHPYISFRGNICLSPCLSVPPTPRKRAGLFVSTCFPQHLREFFGVSYLLVQLRAHLPHSGLPSSSAPPLLLPGPVLSFWVTSSLSLTVLCLQSQLCHGTLLRHHHWPISLLPRTLQKLIFLTAPLGWPGIPSPDLVQCLGAARIFGTKILRRLHNSPYSADTFP